MTNMRAFAQAAKLRHDFADQIMVRYEAGGEDFDTWVSGEEVLQRLKSETREQQVRLLSRLGWDDIRSQLSEWRSEAQDLARDRTERSLRDRLAGAVDEAIGGNLIGDSLADAVRGEDSTADPRETEKRRWQAKLQEPDFRAKVIELAWLNLRGSLPETDQNADDFNDWS